MSADSRWTLMLVLAFAQTAGVGSSFVPDFLPPTEIRSESGNVRLEWKPGPQAAVYEVQKARTESFEQARTIYRGPDLATFVSGLADGIYYFRVRLEGGEWSEAVTLKVQHHSLTLAVTLFSLGALVFALTVAVILRGARDGADGHR